VTHRTRIVVADALVMFRSGARAVLEGETDFDVSEAANFNQLASVLEVDRPEIALIDIDLPPLGGLETISRLAEVHPAAMVAWSLRPRPEAVVRAIRLGAIGYLRKDISSTGLVRMLRGIFLGQAPVARELVSVLVEALQGLGERERAREAASALSVREREVLRLVAGGARNKQIAAALFISEFTVKRHLQNIFQKLDLPSRRAAAAFYESAFGTNELDGISVEERKELVASLAR
jgi:DNA-binding NarL/FixJ family response regulator